MLSTAATELDWIPEDICDELYDFDDSSYKARVYYGVGKADPSAELVLGPNITDWPEQIALPENLLLTTAAAIYDPVTTTDELIPFRVKLPPIAPTLSVFLILH